MAYSSYVSNLVPGDTNDRGDVFVHDRLTHQTTRVSVDTDGQQANGGNSSEAVLSADGRYVAFTSFASDLVPGDTNDRHDVFVHDRKLHRTSRVSVASTGEQGNGSSYGTPALSADGRFVAFTSNATNLAPGDHVSRPDLESNIFVHDRQTHRTRRITHYSKLGNASSNTPSISADGRFVAFSIQLMISCLTTPTS